jgi:hypothetical protein
MKDASDAIRAEGKFPGRHGTRLAGEDLLGGDIRVRRGPAELNAMVQIAKAEHLSNSLHVIS